MLALNMYNTPGLKPPPWLENVCFTPHIQIKYHLPRTKRQRQLKKDREMSSKLVQPEMVMDQLDQLLEDIDKNDVPFLVCTILYFNFNLGLFSRQQFLMMFFLFFPENSI